MWHLGTQFSDGLDSARLRVGPYDLRGLFQPLCVYSSEQGLCAQLQAQIERVYLGFSTSYLWTLLGQCCPDNLSGST